MKALAKSLLTHTPYTIRRRTSLNRFQAIEESLASLARRGFAPDRIVDGGANVGLFTAEMIRMFPGTVVHAVEPQPGCAEVLNGLAERHLGRIEVHAVALCDPESDGTTLTMAANETSRSTGAHVLDQPEPGRPTIAVPCVTLDGLTAAARTSGAACWFVKLDLQGYEIHALKGARETLMVTDVVLSEVSFYTQTTEPRISDLVAFLAAAGFDLYDVASIHARPRDDRPRQGDFVFVRRNSALAADRGWS